MDLKLSKDSDFDLKAAALLRRFLNWSARHPIFAIVSVAVVAIIVNCYPIIFCGRSFVSPSSGVPMVYGGYPALPGMSNTPAVETHGSDSTAMLVWGVPAGFIESRAVLDHGQIPLWNRYSHAGDTFIGQAVTMMGDPLQLIVILGRGSAGAWDIKYVLAKLLFCIGFGLLIRRLVKSVPIALIFTVLAAYCGTFFFIYNHLYFFVFVYAPWILLAAVEMLDLESKRYFQWGMVWLLACFSCFNAGDVELAVILIGGLTLAAIAGTLPTFRNAIAVLTIVGRLLVGTALFFALSAPICFSFFAALKGAFSFHSKVSVLQFRPGSLFGIFDDVFFRIPARTETFLATAPGTSFLIATGCIFAMTCWRELKNEPFFWVNTAALAFWGGCAFGWVPAGLIELVPLLNRVGHTCSDFSFLINLHLTLQCAFGFRCLAAGTSFLQTVIRMMCVTAVLGLTFLLFDLGISHRTIPWSYFLPAIASALGAPLFFVYLRSRGAIAAISWIGVFALGFTPNFRFGLYHAGNKDLMMIPGPRVTLNAPSPAIQMIQADTSSPFRTIGTELNLFGDYAAVYGLEDIRSCAPLSNGELVGLLRGFPGMTTPSLWMVNLQNAAAAHALLNMLNVKYILTPNNLSLPDGLGFRIVQQSDFAVVENLEAWPRAFFSDSIVSISSADGFVQHLLRNEKQPFIALTPPDIAGDSGLAKLQTNSSAAITPATHFELLPNSTTFDVRAALPGVVCLTEGQARDFIATANGTPKVVFTVNRAFKGIYLESPGDYHIVFKFRPQRWGLACGLFWSAIGLIVLLASANFFVASRKR